MCTVNYLWKTLKNECVGNMEIHVRDERREFELGRRVREVYGERVIYQGAIQPVFVLPPRGGFT